MESEAGRAAGVGASETENMEESILEPVPIGNSTLLDYNFIGKLKLVQEQVEKLFDNQDLLYQVIGRVSVLEGRVAQNKRTTDASIVELKKDVDANTTFTQEHVKNCKPPSPTISNPSIASDGIWPLSSYPQLNGKTIKVKKIATTCTSEDNVLLDGQCSCLSTELKIIKETRSVTTCTSQDNLITGCWSTCDCSHVTTVPNKTLVEAETQTDVAQTQTETGVTEPTIPVNPEISKTIQASNEGDVDEIQTPKDAAALFYTDLLGNTEAQEMIANIANKYTQELTNKQASGADSDVMKRVSSETESQVDKFLRELLCFDSMDVEDGEILDDAPESVQEFKTAEQNLIALFPNPDSVTDQSQKEINTPPPSPQVILTQTSTAMTTKQSQQQPGCSNALPKSNGLLQISQVSASVEHRNPCITTINPATNCNQAQANRKVDIIQITETPKDLQALSKSKPQPKPNPNSTVITKSKLVRAEPETPIPNENAWKKLGRRSIAPKIPVVNKVNENPENNLDKGLQNTTNAVLPQSNPCTNNFNLSSNYSSVQANRKVETNHVAQTPNDLQASSKAREQPNASVIQKPRAEGAAAAPNETAWKKLGRNITITPTISADSVSNKSNDRSQTNQNKFAQNNTTGVVQHSNPSTDNSSTPSNVSSVQANRKEETVQVTKTPTELQASSKVKPQPNVSVIQKSKPIRTEPAAGMPNHTTSKKQGRKNTSPTRLANSVVSKANIKPQARLSKAQLNAITASQRSGENLAKETTKQIEKQNNYREGPLIKCLIASAQKIQLPKVTPDTNVIPKPSFDKKSYSTPRKKRVVRKIHFTTPPSVKTTQAAETQQQSTNSYQQEVLPSMESMPNKLNPGLPRTPRYKEGLDSDWESEPSDSNLEFMKLPNNFMVLTPISSQHSLPVTPGRGIVQENQKPDSSDCDSNISKVSNHSNPRKRPADIVPFFVSGQVKRLTMSEHESVYGLVQLREGISNSNAFTPRSTPTRELGPTLNSAKEKNSSKVQISKIDKVLSFLHGD